MATPGRRLDEATRRFILRTAGVLSVRQAAKEARVSTRTVQKVLNQARAITDVYKDCRIELFQDRLTSNTPVMKD